MYVFVTCNFFIITGPLLESTRLDGPDDQETLPYQQQDNDDQPTIPYSNDDQPTMPYQEDQQDDETVPHFDVPPKLLNEDRFLLDGKHHTLTHQTHQPIRRRK